MPSENIFRGNMKETQGFIGFNTIFRGVKRTPYPLAVPQGDECMHLCYSPREVTMVLCWHWWHCWQCGVHEGSRQPPLLRSGDLSWNSTWPMHREGLIFGCRG